MHFAWLLYIKSQWSAGASRTDYSTSLQEMQYTQIQQTAFFPLLFHLFSVRTVLKGRTLLLLQLQCREKRTELRGWEAKGCRGRDGNDLSTASSFQPSVPQQLREERRMKVRRDGEGDVLPQESTCLVDLFLGAPCETYTISLWGSDVKQSSGCELKSCFKPLLFSTLGTCLSS